MLLLIEKLIKLDFSGTNFRKEIIVVNDGSNDIYFMDNMSVPAYGTFTWNDKFVMEGDDDLDVYNQVTNGDWYVSYIDQDWT